LAWKFVPQLQHGQADRYAVFAEEAVPAIRAGAAAAEPLIINDQANCVLAAAVDVRGDFRIGDLQMVHRVNVFQASPVGPVPRGEPDVGRGKRQGHRHADH